jgi:hypothetical protein
MTGFPDWLVLHGSGRRRVMCDGTYDYELYRFTGPEISGYISVSVAKDSVTVEDYNIGSEVYEFFGRDEHEYDVSVTRDDAKKILKANGIIPGPYPAEKLGLYLAERYTGHSNVASTFKKIAEEAGVIPNVWMR